MCLYSSQEILIIVPEGGVHLSPYPISIAWDVSVVKHEACWIVLMGSIYSSRDAIEMTSRSEICSPSSGKYMKYVYNIRVNSKLYKPVKELYSARNFATMKRCCLSSCRSDWL